MFYIQVGMKNKKYFLAIFSRFITIFLGTRGSRDCDVGEGGEWDEDWRLIWTGMFRFAGRGEGRTRGMVSV